MGTTDNKNKNKHGSGGQGYKTGTAMPDDMKTSGPNAPRDTQKVDAGHRDPKASDRTPVVGTPAKPDANRYDQKAGDRNASAGANERRPNEQDEGDTGTKARYPNPTPHPSGGQGYNPRT